MRFGWTHALINALIFALVSTSLAQPIPLPPRQPIRAAEAEINPFEARPPGNSGRLPSWQQPPRPFLPGSFAPGTFRPAPTLQAPQTPPPRLSEPAPFLPPLQGTQTLRIPGAGGQGPRLILPGQAPGQPQLFPGLLPSNRPQAFPSGTPAGTIVFPGQPPKNQPFQLPGSYDPNICFLVAESETSLPHNELESYDISAVQASLLALLIKNDGSRVSLPEWTKLPYEVDDTNLLRMSQGLPPLDKHEGRAVELHHQGQAQNSPLIELWWRHHRGPMAFGILHHNTGAQPSQINREEFRRQRREHWKNRYSYFRDQLINVQRNIGGLAP